MEASWKRHISYLATPSYKNAPAVPVWLTLQCVRENKDAKTAVTADTIPEENMERASDREIPCPRLSPHAEILLKTNEARRSLPSGLPSLSAAIMV